MVEEEDPHSLKRSSGMMWPSFIMWSTSPNSVLRNEAEVEVERLPIFELVDHELETPSTFGLVDHEVDERVHEDEVEIGPLESSKLHTEQPYPIPSHTRTKIVTTGFPASSNIHERPRISKSKQSKQVNDVT